jgi:hypothetical protein
MDRRASYADGKFPMSKFLRRNEIRALEFLDRTELWKQAVLIFFVALAIRFGIVLATRQYLEMNRFEMVRIAISVAERGTLADPYRAPTGPTAHVMPVYPLLLGGVFRLFGPGVTGEIVKEFLTCVMSSAQWGRVLCNPGSGPPAASTPSVSANPL